MPQLHFYIPDDMARAIKEKARSNGMPVSRYVASIVRREVGGGWPSRFFDDVVGGWHGGPLRRAPQGRPEDREAF
jgi:hypothetical protein